MCAVHDNPPSKKRRRYSSEPRSNDSPEDPPSAKRKKRTLEAGVVGGHRTPSFWNRLSKVHLTRGALREFDRRTSRARQPLSTLCFSIDSSSGPGTKSVKRLARHGGPNLTHLRGFAILTDGDDTMSGSSSSRKRASASSGSGASRKKTKSSYDPNFGQNLIDAGIYPRDENSRPNNAQDIRNAMTKPRASLSSSRFGSEDFTMFTRLCNRAGDETTVRAEIMSTIAGESRRNHYYAADRQFNHLKPLADDLPEPRPDLYDGAYPQQIDRCVRRDLGEQIVPSTDTSLPAVPNFFLEGKSEGGRADVAKRQACHNGAIGARAMHYLQNYKSVEAEYDGNAYSYSATYHQGTSTLKLYGHHLTAPKAPGESPECHMTQLKGFDMTSDIDTFRRGAAGFRHLRDRAKTDRDGFIDLANQIARRAPADPPSTAFTNSRTSLSVLQEDESDTTPDEVVVDEVVVDEVVVDEVVVDEVVVDEVVAEQTTAKCTRHATVE